MKTTHLLTVTLLSLFAFTGCEKKSQVTVETGEVTPVAKTKTFETARLRAAIDDFEKTPTAEHAASVDRAFAELDGEIAELKERVTKSVGEDQADAVAKLKNLSEYRAAETVRYTAARAAAGFGTIPADARSGAEKLKDAGEHFKEGAKDAGEHIKEGAKDAGEAIKEGAHKTGDAIKDAFHKAGEKLEKVAE